MHARRNKPLDSHADGVGCPLREEIEADVLELWIGVSRLMSRLREPCRPFDAARPAPGARHPAAATTRLRRGPSGRPVIP